MARYGLEAMDRGGCITLGTFQAEDAVVLMVKDQGPGIPDEVLAKIGTPFYTTKENGTGLGLSICHSIASCHNATISIETGPTGTTFYVRFRCE